jgi:hypothetical protein
MINHWESNMMSEGDPQENRDGSHRVAFDYIKSQVFRVVHVDGVIGSMTPHGNIHLAFYSERPAIPRRVVHQLSPLGELGDPIPNETVSRDSIVREVDFDAHMSLRAAKSLLQWLAARIAEADAAQITQKVPGESPHG